MNSLEGSLMLDSYALSCALLGAWSVCLRRLASVTRSAVLVLVVLAGFGCDSGPTGPGVGAPMYRAPGYDAGAGGCFSPCTPSAATCTQQGLIRTCVQGGDGCWQLSSPASCPTGQVCKDQDCVKACSDDCADGQTECSVDGLKKCTLGVDTCWHWGEAQPCVGGLVCESGSCTACIFHTQCDDLSVCREGKCLLASGLEYVFTFVGGTVPESDENGSAWDSFGGAPDPFVELYKNDVRICFTDAASDTFKPWWGESCTVEIGIADKIVFMIRDLDLTDHDAIDGVEFNDTIAMLKAGGGLGELYTGSTSTLTWTVEPK